MKGLLLKDWYMMKKYCRSYLLIAVVFIAVSLVGDNNLFFVFYPCLLCGMIPVNLLAYDERSHWDVYCGTLPVTRDMVVSAKYIVGLGLQAVVFLLSALGQAVRIGLQGRFDWESYLVLMSLMAMLSLFSSSITLPFMFKLGVEKGRMAYYVMIGLVCAAIAAASVFFKGQLQNEIRFKLPLVAVTLICIGLYALSWYLSIVFYRKREI